MENIFVQQFEEEAIDRIRRFAALAGKMGYVPVLGFSGGKDSQVCYDLCKRAGIEFRACFNHCFESATTLKFIREYYPEVEWRREVKEGFFENIRKNHNGLLPTVEISFCCTGYKHNPAYIDPASIVGVRKVESAKRASRRVLETKNMTYLKKHKEVLTQYFSEGCMASGAPSEITLYPIVDWTDDEVWDYISRRGLPINPEYKHSRRVGCVICPKANLTSNYRTLMAHPKLIDCAIKARSSNLDYDWRINSEGIDLKEDKVEYICRWLNHSFRPFTAAQRAMCDDIKRAYQELHNKNKTKQGGKTLPQHTATP